MRTTRARRLLVVTILAGLLTASSALAQKDDQAEVLMQAAHQKQLVEGQLEEAIQLYKRIVQEHSGDRAVAAKALLEMGQCYEKLGKMEARKAYERVLRDYADQNEAAAQARTRLAALSGNGTWLSSISPRERSADWPIRPPWLKSSNSRPYRPMARRLPTPGNRSRRAGFFRRVCVLFG